ncbi:MAG: chorismate mutase [Thermoleophilia bacterium]|nr:chorismate mutase [Thermoleophilia bacterium]
MTEDGWRLIAVRGATTVESDTAAEVRERTAELLTEIMERNSLKTEDIVSIIFTATPDVVSDFPAVAARSIGLSQVPLLCSQEIPVTGSIERCIRLLMHAYSDLGRSAIRHAYLRGARQLRTDLPE